MLVADGDPPVRIAFCSNLHMAGVGSDYFTVGPEVADMLAGMEHSGGLSGLRDAKSNGG